MKKLFLILTLVVPFLFSCSDDNVTPGSMVTQSFNAKYPDAVGVRWETKGNYLNAEFVNDRFSSDAWFDKSGNWFLTKTELREKGQLPAEVLSTLNGSEYAEWFVDDIDYIERNNEEDIYIIEVKQNNLEYDLYFSADGVLIKTRPDSNDDDDYYNEFLSNKPTNSQSDIRTIILEKYPDSRIIEIENEMNKIEIDIIHENRGKEVLFNLKNEWINTHFDIRKNEVIAVVMEALNNSAYADYIIDDIEYYETPSGNFYLFELEKGAREINIRIDILGNIL